MVEQPEIHRKSRSKKAEEREEAAEQLGKYFAILEDKEQAWEDLIKLMQDKNDYVQRRAANSLGAVFSAIPEERREEAWADLHKLTQDKNDYVRRGAVDALGAAYSHILDEHKQQAWEDMHKLTQDKDDDVRWRAANALGAVYPSIPDEHKQEAWEDLHRLAQDKNDNVRRGAADTLGAAFSTIPEKHKEDAWEDLHKLTQDKNRDVRIAANHSLGRASILRAGKAENDDEFQKELEKAIQFFEKASKEATYFNPSQFCLPFYRSFYTITFRKEEAAAEVKKYLNEAKRAVGVSKNKEKLLEAVENLSNALKEAEKARTLDARICDLNKLRQYCDHTVELLDSTEKTAPVVTNVIEKELR